MTEEEMAKEYVTQNGFGSDCNNLTSYDANEEIEKAFLAGLKADRPKWHKDKYAHSEKDKPLPCGKVEGYYRVILYDNYKEPQIVRPETEIEFVGNLLSLGVKSPLLIRSKLCLRKKQKNTQTKILECMSQQTMNDMRKKLIFRKVQSLAITRLMNGIM